MQILNRLGCVNSPDTHDKFVIQHAEANRESSMWNDLPSETFTIASVDNFDVLQSYSAVYCGDQQRSYHGTTIQLVQPDPNIFTMSNNANASTPSDISFNSRLQHTSEVGNTSNHSLLTEQAVSNGREIQKTNDNLDSPTHK